jgi:hypothetical protein
MLDPVAVRAEYVQKHESHCRVLRELVQRLGGSCTRLGTDQPLELALFDFLRARSSRGRRVRRAGRVGAGGAV